jgi:Sec-independent protein translocase protein TatA
MAKIAFTTFMFIMVLGAVIAAVAMIPKALRSSIDFIREWRSLQTEAKQDRPDITNQDSSQD